MCELVPGVVLDRTSNYGLSLGSDEGIPSTI